jgi:hypothetical protein
LKQNVFKVGRLQVVQANGVTPLFAGYWWPFVFPLLFLFAVSSTLVSLGTEADPRISLHLSGVSGFAYVLR